MSPEVSIALITGLSAVIVATITAGPTWRRQRRIENAVGERNGKGSLMDIIERIETAVHVLRDDLHEVRDRVNRLESRELEK